MLSLVKRAFSSMGVAILAVSLTACAVAPTPTTELIPEEGNVFTRGGRFALSVERTDGKKDAVQGGFQWEESPQQLQLDLNNPMGTVLARVLVTPQGAALQYPNGEVEYASSPDALVEQLLGYMIPVAGMRDWLRGQTGPTPHVDLQLEAGQPSYFQQDNWRVHLKRYDEQGPRLLQMYRNQAQQNISVRVVIDY